MKSFLNSIFWDEWVGKTYSRKTRYKIEMSIRR
jgi:hypothetical protein